MRHKWFISLTILLLFLFLADISLGTIFISPLEIFKTLTDSSDQSTNYFIITQLRLPRAIMAVLTGAGLAVAGLLMQTLFRNPLAGPFVLGISSGSGLGVALLVLGSSVLGWQILSGVSIVLASILGSVAVLILIILLSLRVKDTMGLLIVGLMMGSISSAIVGILSYFSSSDELQRYVFWSLGSLGGVDWVDLALITALFFICGLMLLFIIKPLNTLLLGENYAKSLGINIKQTRWIIIIITSLLAGSITAFAGPIAFIGLAVPHLSRLLLPEINHKVLIPMVMLLGAALLLFCDLIAQLPFSSYSIPINAVTSILGAPLVIWLIYKKRNLRF